MGNFFIRCILRVAWVIEGFDMKNLKHIGESKQGSQIYPFNMF